MQINKDYLKKHQYKNADNLATRRDLFRYSTNSEPFWQWVTKQYSIKPKSKILEVGCGSGEFWYEAVKIFPKDYNIVLTDLSPGMLGTTQKNLAHLLNCQFEVVDVECLPYKDQSFDVVFAHLMLYHTASKKDALKEIKRVLTDDGFVGILLSGENNMQSLFTLLSCENPRQAAYFTAEMAAKLLPRYFSNIKHRIYRDTLKITDVEPIISYIRSFSGMDEKSDDFYANCKKILMQEIEQKGSVSFETSRHLFIAS